MLTRSFIVALLMGMALGLTSNVAIAQVQATPRAKAAAAEAERKAEKKIKGRHRPAPSRVGRQTRGGMGGMTTDGMGRMGSRNPGMPGGMGRTGSRNPGMPYPFLMGGPGMERGMRSGRGFGSMQKSDPEMYKLLAKDRELEQETMALIKQIRRAPAEPQENSDQTQEEIKEQLKKVVARHFEVRQERRQLELMRMEKELQRLKEAIQRRQAVRDDIINSRIMRLTGEKDPLSF